MVHPEKHQQISPLYTSINGPVKSIEKSISNKIFIKDPFAKYTLENSINSLVQSIKKIKEETIINSFNLACNIKKITAA